MTFSPTPRPSLSRLLAFALVACALLPGAALGQDEPKRKVVDRKLAISTGKALLEGAEPERKRALARATALGAAEQRVLVAWARDHVSDSRIGNLIPLLRRLNSQSSGELLIKIAAAPRGEEDDGSVADEALDVLLFAQRVSRGIPLATEAALLTTDANAARRIKSMLLELLKEGPDEEKVSEAVMMKLLVTSIQKVMRGSDLPPGTRARAVSLVSSWLEDTDDLRDVLQLVKRRLEDQDRIFLDGFLQGVSRRRENLLRPIHLLRAQEVNRRRKLDAYKREQMASLESWLEDRIARDKQLSRLSRRIKKDDAIFEELLLDRFANSESRTLKLEILKLVPLFAKDADSAWVAALIPELQGAVGPQAYQLIKQITGESIPQNSVLWRRWFDGEDTEQPSGGDK